MAGALTYRQGPQHAASHFLPGYHDMTCGHPDDAERSLREVVALMPNARVAEIAPSPDGKFNFKMLGDPERRLYVCQGFWWCFETTVESNST